MQRKLYNNFYVKPEMDFYNFSVKSNDKSCEWTYKNKSYHQLTSSNKVDDTYLDNLKAGCAGCVGVCALSCTFTKIAGATAAAKSLLGSACTDALLTKLTNILFGVNLFSESAIKSAAASSGISAVTSTSTGAATALTTFLPYGIAIYVIITVTITVIYLYVLIRERRKHSWKHEYKKHLCT